MRSLSGGVFGGRQVDRPLQPIVTALGTAARFIYRVAGKH
jgi:hypothetical protein